MNSAKSILEQLAGRTVLVVGDVMIDRYLTGKVSRISPEAPVPVVLHQHTEDRLGGAANVALNIKALGSTPLLCSVIGNDEDAKHLRALMPDAGLEEVGLTTSKMRRTTVKTRILGNFQQMLRIDSEDTHDLHATEEATFLSSISSLLDSRKVDAVILQDYNKGVLTEKVITEVIRMAREKGIMSAADPKKKNFFAFREIDLFKPNLKEIQDSTPFPIEPTVEALKEADAYLQEKLHNKMTMITLSEKGLYLNSGEKEQVYPTVARNISDVSGAGDTVISIATLAFCAGFEEDIVAVLSNLAGGQVCEFPGVVPVKPELLEKELDQYTKSA